MKKIAEMENNLIYKSSNKKKDKTYDFQKFKTIRSFGREIYNNDLSQNDAHELQIRLKYDIDVLKESTKPKESVKEEEKAVTLKNVIELLNGRQKALNIFKSVVFPKEKQGKVITSILDRVAKVFNCKVSDHSNLKILLLNKCFKNYQ